MIARSTSDTCDITALRGATRLCVAVCSFLSPVYAQTSETSDWCGPKYIHVEADGGKLLVLCEKSNAIVRMDVDSGDIEATTAVGESPWCLCPHPTRPRLFVTCRRGQQLLELDAVSLATLRRIDLSGDPTGVAVSEDGQRVYVALHSLDQLAVLDAETGNEIKRLATGNGPQSVRLAAGTGRVYVTNLLSNPTSPDQPCRNEITTIDDILGHVVERIILVNANVGRGFAFTSDGSTAIAAISRPKNLLPMVQVARGWMVTNGFAVLSTSARHPPIQLLVDLPNQSFADPYGIAVTPDDRKCYLTSAGTDTVVAIDLDRVRAVVEEVSGGLLPRHADDLGLTRRYVTARVPVGANPEALALSPDGHWLYVANRLDDSISVVDTGNDRVIRTLDIGPPPPADKLLRGERLFHSAARTFQRQFSCASCHPDGGFDGLQYDLEPDGLGQCIVDNRDLRDVSDTAPFKWAGTNPDVTTQCGTRTAKWFVRTGWLTLAQVVELTGYVHSIPLTVNPYRDPSGVLTPAQRRGKVVFERTTTAKGGPIPEQNRCATCHSGPKFTNGRRSDVGTKALHDTNPEFDAAHLTNVFESTPYLHDGRAATLEEIWTKYNPEDKHGLSSDWTKQQLNDLVEYLKSL